MRKPKLENLDVLRAFACLGVFTYHCYVSLLGTWGVSVFIMMSGFLLTYNSLGKADSLPADIKGCLRYSFGKTKKLYPLYFFTLLMLVLRIVLLAPDDPPADVLIHFAKQFVLCVLLVQSWLPGKDWGFAFNGVGWYVCTTAFLYFAFPWILREIKKLKSTGRAFLYMVLLFVAMLPIALALTALYISVSGSPMAMGAPFDEWLVYIFPPYRLLDFTIGCLLGYVFLNRKPGDISRGKATALEAAAILLTALSQWIMGKYILPGYISANMLFVPSTALLIYAFALGRGSISNVLNCGFTRLIADYSVEIFLIHYAVIKYASPFAALIPGPYVLQQIAFVAFVFIATISSVIIWRRLGKRFPVLAVK